jgi:hypothetical protein
VWIVCAMRDRERKDRWFPILIWNSDPARRKRRRRFAGFNRHPPGVIDPPTSEKSPPRASDGKKQVIRKMNAQKGTLNASVTPAGNGLHGFDTDTPLPGDLAAAFQKQGFQFCIRYLSCSTPQAGGDLSSSEAQGILDAGLSLMAVQHVMEAGWVPTLDLGTQLGAAAATNAQAVGFPPGVTVWLDLEGIHGGVGSDDVIAYCNAWFDAVTAVGYEPGVYVGTDCVLSGDELFWRLKTKHYWRSGSSVPDIPNRGYQLVQRASSDVMNGIGIDRDLCLTDALGGTPIWLSPDNPTS